MRQVKNSILKFLFPMDISQGSKLIVYKKFEYTISLVANKLGKNMLAFAEELSYSQDDKNVLLLKAKIKTST